MVRFSLLQDYPQVRPRPQRRRQSVQNVPAQQNPFSHRWVVERTQARHP
jgi:hypothetical protein